jgi:aminocarboxymuconate-semialdehyde decarboxylase
VNNCRRPRDYLRSFYVDSLVHDARTLRFLIELMSVERIALGSDYPFPLGEEHPGRLIEAMPELSDAHRERLLSGTALEFLGLRREVFASHAGARS